MSNSFWNIHLIVSRFVRDEIQPIWRVCKISWKSNENSGNDSTFTKVNRNFVQQGFFPRFCSLWPLSIVKAHRCAKKDGFLDYFDRIYHIWKFESDSEILKNSPPQGGEGRPSGRGGRPLRLLRRGRTFRNFRIAFKLSDMINSIKMIKKTIFFAHRWACSVLRGHNEQNRGKKPCWKKFRFTFVEVLSFPEFSFDFHEILHTYFKLVVFHHVQTAKRSDEYFKSYSTSNRGPIFFGTDCIIKCNQNQSYSSFD